MKLKVGTFNILNTSCRYIERAPYISSSISKLDCDILGLQEVNLSGNSEILTLPGYHSSFLALPSPMLKEEPEFRIDGNMILLRDSIEILDTFNLTFSNNLRVAQFLHVRLEATEFIIGNTHLDHLSDSTRLQQVQELLAFSLQLPQLPTIITGDFNFHPNSAAYTLMTTTFHSSFREINKREAVLTFPTGLFGTYTDTNKHGAFDYIFTRGPVRCSASKVFTDCGLNTLFASDHYPVSSDLTLQTL